MRAMPRWIVLVVAVGALASIWAALAPATDMPFVRPQVTAMVSKALPSVVSITTRRIAQGEFNRRVPSAAIGSGVIVDAKGHVLTNEHVVRGATVIKVTLTDGRSFYGTLLGADRFTDLAVLKIEGTDLKPLSLGDSSKLRVGDPVVAIGSPLWIEGGPTVTTGVIGGSGRTMEEPDDPEQATLHYLLQTDAAINPGNSGGPLLNLRGEVVGINTAIMESAHGIGFVIPINNAKPVMEILLTHGQIVRPTLKLVAVSVTPQLAFTNDLPVEHGVLVVKPVPGGPGEAAGLLADDVIVTFQGVQVADLHHLHALLERQKPGDTVELVVRRGDETIVLPAVLIRDR